MELTAVHTLFARRRYRISYRNTLAQLIALNTYVPLASPRANVFVAPPLGEPTPVPADQ